MRKKDFFLMLILVLVGLTSFAVAARVTAQRDGNSGVEAPPWVRSDGTVDIEKLPECFEVVGADGQTVLDDSGEPLCIPSAELYAPPSEPPPVPDDSAGPTMMRDGIEVREVPMYRPGEH